jgi:hypothetical protein
MAFLAQHLEELKDALVQAFSEEELKQLVRFALTLDLDSITSKGNRSDRVFELLTWAQREGNPEQLFYAALARKPGNPKLQALAAAAAATQSGPVWKHRMNLVPSIWDAKWKMVDGKQIKETMQIRSWTGENEFEGFGFSFHGTRSRKQTYNYNFCGRIEPVGVILLEYRAEDYPIAGAKNVGVAILEIQDEKRLTGFFAGYRDERDRERLENDRLTHPEKAVEPGKFYVPFGSMSHYGGTVEMVRSGRGR